MKHLRLQSRQHPGWAVVLLSALIGLEPDAGRWTHGAAPVPVTEASSKGPVAVPPGPDLSEPTPARLRRWIEDIEREVVRLRAAGKRDMAEQLERQLGQFQGRQEGNYPAPISDGPELHLVGVHVGAQVGQQKIGTAAVEVSYTGRPIILALCAYNPVQWTVHIGKGARVKEVIVGGYHDQQVLGLPADTPVRYRVHEKGSRDYFYCSRRDFGSFLRTIEVLRELTGCSIATFQGKYEYQGAPLVVGPTNADWRTEHILWDMRALHESATLYERQRLWQDMQKLKFRALHFVPTGRVGQTCAFAEFTPTGPLMKSLKPLDGYVSHVALDPQRATLYGFAMHEVGTLDMENGKFTRIPFDARLPEVSSPCAIAFDSKRGRLLWDSFGGGGHLYAYDVNAKSWSVVTKPGLGVWGLVYNPDDDLLYGVKATGGSDAAYRSVVRFNARGALVDEVKLSQPIPPGGSLRVQLALVGQRLVILVPPGSAGSEGPRKPLPPCTYVVDPVTGKITFDCAQQPQNTKEGK